MVTGQDKKNEQKIKVIVKDESGTRVVIDTVFKDMTGSDSIKLKDGSVFFMKHNCDDAMICCKSNEGRGRGKYKVVTMSSGEHRGKGSVIYINKGKASENEADKSFDVYLSDDGKESVIEKSRYVIAKDGMVVTIEGNDETKTKELAKEIENKLGAKSDGTSKIENQKTEAKKKVTK